MDGFADRMCAATGGTVEMVLDQLFGVPAAAAVRMLRPHGRLVNLPARVADRPRQARRRFPPRGMKYLPRDAAEGKMRAIAGAAALLRAEFTGGR